MVCLHLFSAVGVFIIGLLSSHVSYSYLYCSEYVSNTGAFLKNTHERSALVDNVINSFPVFSLLECASECLRTSSKCKSLNLKEKNNTKTCELSNIVKDSVESKKFLIDESSTYTELEVNSVVYCDGPWTLIARFSNKDEINWMRPEGTWWYDTTEARGDKLSSTQNQDMISEAFWLQKGSELKITRSDDVTHTALLTTTNNCLGGMTFRAKMTSYGVFRDKDCWAVDKCLGQCSVVYGGDFRSVDGFNQSECDGNIQMGNQIGMWCDFIAGDGSVLMIGGGGTACSRADHGIGITEENDASFQDNSYQNMKFDFGGDANFVFPPPTQAYALNLWVR